MTHRTDDPQVLDMPDTPPSPAQALLQSSLERSLTADELSQLRAAAQADPAVADDCATFGLLTALRLEQRMARHEASAWEAFQALARQHATDTRTAAPATARDWRQWLAAWRPAMPALAAFATVVVMVQAGALLWLAQRPVQEGDMRGTGGSATCPAVLVRLAPLATAGDLTRVLTQAQARLVDGPDGEGAYRVVGPQSFVQDADVLFSGLAQDVRPAPGCTGPAK